MDISSAILKNFIHVVDLLKNAKVPFCVVGGMAVSIISRPRATEDLDFLVGIRDEDKGELADLLKEKLTVLQVKEQTFTVSGVTIWRIVLSAPEEPDGTVIVDFLFADNEFLEAVIDGADNLVLGGVETPLVRPEDLILMKMLASRPQDLNDIATIREVHADTLDEAYIASWQEKLGLDRE